MRVHGRDLDLASLRQFVGNTSQVVGLRQLTLGDGVERGIRAVEARTAGGLDVTCLVDRALDVADASIGGIPISWKAQTGFAAPWFYDPSPMGLRRTIGGGLFFTAGLDHAQAPAPTDSTDSVGLLAQGHHPLHGRVAHTPSRLVEVSEALDREPAVLRIRAKTEQASLFGEHLELDRIVETRVGDPLLRVHDTVTNVGGTPSPHMMLYHVNLGFPLLAPGAQPFGSDRIRSEAASTTASRMASTDIAFRAFGEPIAGQPPEVFCHELKADSRNHVHAGLYNPDLRLAVGVSWKLDALPYLLEWRVERSGTYVLGLEPSTNAVGGRKRALEEGKLRVLEPGEATEYELEFRGIRGESLEEVRSTWHIPEDGTV